MMLAPATGYAAPTIAQPQRAADRRGNRPPSTSHIENLTGFAGRNVHARAIASEHAGDVMWDRRAVAQKASNAAGGMLELLERGHHDQLVAGAQRARIV